MVRLRKNTRLTGFDYSTPGGYFVTICTASLRCLFGEVVDGQMKLNGWGALVQESWEEIPFHYPEVRLDAFQVMPNHLHGTLFLEENADMSRRHSLGVIVGSIKAAASRRIRAHIAKPAFPIWQTSYYEHIIRNDDSLLRIREYILNNPLKWELDRYNRHATDRRKGDNWLDFLGGS